MDTSEAYIKMCNCKYIQIHWKPEPTDFIGSYDKKYGYDWQTGCMCSVYKTSYRNEKCALDYIEFEGADTFWDIQKPIWLPCQHQIQKMFSWHRMDLIFRHQRGCGKPYSLNTNDGKEDIFLEADSMEQLWLEFYMLKKHKKIWDGKKWLKK